MRVAAKFLACLGIVAAVGCSPTPEEQALELVSAYGGEIRTNREGQVISVDLSDTAAGDDVVAALAVFPKLQTLNCTHAGRIAGHGLGQLAGLAELESLYLVGSGLDDHGLSQLSGLTSLKTLQVGSTKITDAGLPALDQLTNLETLSLSDTAVSDRGLVELRDLRHLSTLMIRNTATSPRGILELRRMLPDVRIVD